MSIHDLLFLGGAFVAILMVVGLLSKLFGKSEPPAPAPRSYESTYDITPKGKCGFGGEKDT